MNVLVVKIFCKNIMLRVVIMRNGEMGLNLFSLNYSGKPELLFILDVSVSSMGGESIYGENIVGKH